MAAKPTTETQAPPETPPAKATKQQGSDGAYYIVNPAGAIHSVSRAHAFDRLKSSPGWRMATEAEITQYKGQKTQVADSPIAAPWSPDPDAQLAALEV